MLLVRLRIAAILVSITVATGFAFQSSQPNRPWPPGVQQVSSESPVLSPADAVKTFYMPPGYHVELVASEPLVQDPTVMDWDLDGRLWVVEMTGFVLVMLSGTIVFWWWYRFNEQRQKGI